MAIKAAYQRYTLNFKFEAGTSRGVLHEKDSYFIKIWDEQVPEIVGIGEASPLAGLSVDDVADFELQLVVVLKALSGKPVPSTEEEIFTFAHAAAGDHLPAVRFALEVALLDLLHGGKRISFDNEFVNSAKQISINGLVWMGDMESMLVQVTDKMRAGFDCIKLKVGAIDFEKECDLLDYIRRKYYQQPLVLRVDANGAFSAEDALYKLNMLSKYNLHSIEQPVKARQPTLMKSLCSQSPVPIALDEELIGVNNLSDKQALLEEIAPAYIILKPTLVGGIQSCKEWIDEAEARGIGWWLTSALESNIGLNAICQMAEQYQATGHQGLGTGKLYHNNIDSPLVVEGGYIRYDSDKSWDLSILGV